MIRYLHKQWKTCAVIAVITVLPVVCGAAEEDVSPESSGGQTHADAPASSLPKVSVPDPVPTAPTRVYRKINADGSVTFSDVEAEGADAVDVQPANTVPRYDRPVAPKEAASKPPTYSACQLVAPEQDATMGVDVTSVTIAVEVSPGLQEGDGLQFFANDKPLGAPNAATSFTMSNLERGSYTVVAKVVNAKGDVLCTSDGVTFHVKRASVLFQGSVNQRERDKLAVKEGRRLPDEPMGFGSAGGFPGAGGFGSAGGVGIPPPVPPEAAAPK